MTEEDELWVPETWEKEDEDKMVKRVGEGFEQCLELSEGCTCELPSLVLLIPIFPRDLLNP